jgi:hypothetical protein
MPYYKENNLLFIHIPKTGGTSLEEYLKQTTQQTLYSIGDFNNILFEQFQIKTVSLQHLTYEEIYNYKDMLDIDFNDNLKIITIVRNPYDKLISGLFFNNLIDENTNNRDVYNIIKTYIYSDCYDNHNKPQYTFLTYNKDSNNIIPNITIFRTETLKQDLHNYGFHDFDLNFQMNSKNIKRDKYINYLSSKSIKLINNFYKKDFELFNYKMMV